MDFYKKLSFSILAFIFCFAVMIKLVEPVIERQISNISADIGDEVVLWGDGLPLNEIANTANTIGYELTARMPKRVPRIVIDN